MVDRQIVDEILALNTLKIQKIWELFGSIIVMAGYSPVYKRLFVVFDQNPKTQAFYVANEKLKGVKTSSPFTALVKKYLTDQILTFVAIGEEGRALRANFSKNGEDFAVIFEISPRRKIGLFRGTELVASFKKDQAPLFRDDIVPPRGVTSGLCENFEQSHKHREALLSFHKNALINTRISNLNRDLKKKTTLLKNLQNDIDKSMTILALVDDGELLRANFHLLKKGMKEVVLMDYAADPPAKKTVFLDGKSKPQEFIDKLFTKIKKAKRGLGIISTRIEGVKEEIAFIEKEKADAEKIGLKKSDIVDINSTIASQNKNKKRAFKRFPYRAYLSSDGVKILVGRSAKDSDDLTLHYAHGNEWWLHAHNATGAHVVVKNGTDSLPQNTLVEAAMLAAHFSKNKLDHRVSIQYTRVKYVRKPKGLPFGKVLIAQEKTIDVEMDAKALKSLLAREQKAAA